MNRSLLVLSALAAPFFAQAQVPNGGFESWSGGEPTGWITLNMLDPDLATQGMPGAVGTSCIVLTTQNVEGFGVFPSIVTTGDMLTESDGFPYTQRPGSLNGSLKFSLAQPDTASILVVLSRWNAATQERIGVAGGFISITLEAETWMLFDIPLIYSDAGNPDTASIVMMSGTGLPGSAGTALSVDDLHFTGTAAGMDEATANSGLLRVFPNPANELINVLSTDGGQLRALNVWSVEGRLVRTEPVLADRATVDVSGLQPGSYVMRAERADGTVLTTRFVKD